MSKTKEYYMLMDELESVDIGSNKYEELREEIKEKFYITVDRQPSGMMALRYLPPKYKFYE